jgi:PmbA protein
MINNNEINIAKFCIGSALKQGASAARVSLSKSIIDSYMMLNGELDKVTHSADRSIYLYIYADGRYGNFSTNRLETSELEDFIGKAISMVRMLGEDSCRTLPEASRTATDAKTGRELDLYDECFGQSSSDLRLDRAGELTQFRKLTDTADKNGFITSSEWGHSFHLISEECEYSESFEDNYVCDSQGFEGRHTETSFSTFCEMTIEDSEGNKYSGFWWEATPKFRDLNLKECSQKALDKAVRQIAPKSRRGGRYKMVVDCNAASRLVSPLFTALNASSIQQKMSFLDESLGTKVFPEGLTIMDLARTTGKAGSRLFDTEGVATTDSPIIENGVVKKYFVNTYMANKMGIAPTIEDISRPCVMPYMEGKALSDAEKSISLKDILQHCGNGILVTGFNGGNCNPATGDFSFGVEGFAFSKGKISHPVREMLITGNLIELWNNLIAAGTDARSSARWQIPSLAFEDVSFSA